MPMSNAANRVLVFALLALAPDLAQARDVVAGPLVIQHPWARATPGGAQVGGGYLTVLNRGQTAETLVGGSFAASAGFELHAMTMDGGVMKMRPTGPLEIPAGGAITLDPSGKHIMFTGLKRGLTKGETVAGTLVFQHAGVVPVEFDVEGIGARAPGKTDGASAAHGMPGMQMN